MRPSPVPHSRHRRLSLFALALLLLELGPPRLVEESDKGISGAGSASFACVPLQDAEELLAVLAHEVGPLLLENGLEHGVEVSFVHARPPPPVAPGSLASLALKLRVGGLRSPGAPASVALRALRWTEAAVWRSVLRCQSWYQR